MAHAMLMRYVAENLNAADDEYDVRRRVMFGHFVEYYFHVIHVGYVRFSHRLFLVGMNQVGLIHHVRIHLVGNAVDDVDYRQHLMKIYAAVLSKGNIIHNSQDRLLSNTVEHSDEQHVELAVRLINK